MRRSIVVTFVLSLVVNVGMWFERFVIIVTSLNRDFLPSSWSYYTHSWVELAVYVFTFGVFGLLYLVFVRIAPVVAMAEIKSILKSSGDQYVGPNAKHHDSHKEEVHA